MKSYKEVFTKKNVLLPVVHVTDPRQVVVNIRIAGDNGADGVFLINHGDVSHNQLLAFLSIGKDMFPDMWFGVNFLDLTNKEAFRNAPSFLDGIWSDNAFVEEVVELAGNKETYDLTVKGGVDFKGLFFGGVAFKYQAQPRLLGETAFAATQYVDVITTSGDKTGEPPSVEKIRTMRMAIDEHPLAVASGMTPENVSQYLDFVDCFLVATGINVEGDFYNLDPLKVRDFVKAIA